MTWLAQGYSVRAAATWRESYVSFPSLPLRSTGRRAPTVDRVAWDFETEPEFQAKLDWMESFVRDEIIPLETLAEEWRSPEGRATLRRITDPLKDEVKKQGLWAAHLPPDMGGLGLAR